MKNSSFKSEARRDQFRYHYRQILSQFPFGQQFIRTTFGQTFVLTAGQEPNPPVILLHGSCSNSAFWLPEIMALSGSYSVYAVDIIGEAGNSEEFRPDLDSDAFAVWLKEVLDALNLPKTDVFHLQHEHADTSFTIRVVSVIVIYFFAEQRNLCASKDPGGPIMKTNSLSSKCYSLLLILILLLTPIAPVIATGEAPVSLVPALMTGNTVSLAMQIDSTWEGYFNATITLTNTGEKPIENWALSFSFPHTITSIMVVLGSIDCSGCPGMYDSLEESISEKTKDYVIFDEDGHTVWILWWQK